MPIIRKCRRRGMSRINHAGVGTVQGETMCRIARSFPPRTANFVQSVLLARTTDEDFKSAMERRSILLAEKDLRSISTYLSCNPGHG